MVTLEIRQGREKSILQRHPWVFSGSVFKERGEGPVCELVDRQGATLAWGLHSPASQIRARILEWRGYEPGRERIIGERVREAAALRRLLCPADTDAFRLINAEGDGLPGVTVDCYGETMVVATTTAGWEPVREEWLYPHLRKQWPARYILEKNRGDARALEELPQEDRWLGGGSGPAMPIRVRENGLQFFVDVREGQKTGFFLDQRANRAAVRALASGAEVLNTFAYTGAFSVYALKGGARSVENVDTSTAALELSRANHEANGVAGEGAIHIREDAFAYLRHLQKRGRRFDLVILDPPALGKQKAHVDAAARGYKDLNLQALRLLRPGGILVTCSCSAHISATLFQQILFAAALDARVSVRLLRKAGADWDHPINLYCPESEYLKTFFCQTG
jgi:23S rRNA (cytosine1962-C5)-methyltransferase